LRCTRRRGGCCKGRWRGSFVRVRRTRRRQAVSFRGWFCGAGGSLSAEAFRARALDFLVRNRTRWPFDKLVSHTYPLEQINEAFTEMNRGEVARSIVVM